MFIHKPEGREGIPDCCKISISASNPELGGDFIRAGAGLLLTPVNNPHAGQMMVSGRV